MSAQDLDPLETQEWLEAFKSVARVEGDDRAKFLLNQLMDMAHKEGMDLPTGVNTSYLNSIAKEKEVATDISIDIEERISAIIRWNAMVMVVKANQLPYDLGGHIASFASSATLYEVGFNHFYRGPDAEQGADLIFFQGHISPGIYSRAFLEGRITEAQMLLFRQEAGKDGLSSYPHPWLMPDFWQFPTVSMGLGPIMAIYQARFMKYLHHREIKQTHKRTVWAYLGDGEMDEPESLGAISVAGREKLDNLIFVINCNLQRLDGPVRGNGKIIQELEGMFRGAGWNVLKVIWGGEWDKLLEKDTTGLLKKRMEEVVDGEYQAYKAKDGAYVRQHFFGKYPELLAMVQHLSDDEIYALNRGGHDPFKVFQAYRAAKECSDKPTVILAKTVKGYGMGEAGEGQNTTHSQKKLGLEQVAKFAKRFDIPVTEEDVKQLNFYKPAQDSEEMTYINTQRQKLGGSLPVRSFELENLQAPELNTFSALLKSSGEREMSTTMALNRIMALLVRDKQLGSKVVPIIPDEARTFGMESLFRQLGIYSASGQLYQPEDSDKVMWYKEDKKGQVLQEGINEAGAISDWIAAATSYATHNVTMIPFYIYYSKFGFQRVGDLIWAAGDMQAKGFLIGGTAGRTTLNGEGLQHEDGDSHIVANTIPNCISYDPTYAYELAVIVQSGLRRMYEKHENIFYYITVMNEIYTHPEIPAGTQEGIIKGIYPLKKVGTGDKQVQLLGSGTILREVEKAAQMLADDWGVKSNIWSVTSFNELTREAQAIDRENRFSVGPPKVPYITQCLANAKGPVIATTDYMRNYAEQVRKYIPARYEVLGTDGFGRSDSRAALRDFFEVDANYVTIAALKALVDEGEIAASVVTDAIKKYGVDIGKPNPMTV
ncbi:pyruvate dehydrogenase (acetyl-transferring), homodimeric type [thiotrophic endosymbiont of Bathymodiolus puteoserpentis (Logatchev)]|jgi:pyruvate dehydrogenase E1 component|uniref:pyruvate dehydrogenase (acetyl-transferring), homodimeric type n=1 Tax=thiotrophic endosymbiont of Bathymodiolus puteoserpentis (Logatchev) TaxID=343240 RepID=UPI0010B4152E|nr:pyruvate dehydrogenase (acetyl-transferring), homodimeric type [thiotrophic endosymbiont of Bathymodiolus puteoserpentis (Logatchev)]CAC9586508.1 Pyruvate dehydrogenase E1 component (EC 1.2.4.1) [uncultured Gammaproteobacteria bacterium]CAC9589561.1 Pyruvate dehydrogenase E1 component (EC 1.2.4.1) [uncultured Gammaproteobacteria bacterium]CAC9991546.1 Pyruvate dehydrogenase E1 component (EC 1.2.4.1) [uncultured Gammaproteobacteria bacterium]SSC09917.1 Pyruvate dehydrogenase E1 component [thi